jgi:hypothetical protein
MIEHVSHDWHEGGKTLHQGKGVANPRYTGFHDDRKYTLA